jgi:hypothetical protein
MKSITVLVVASLLMLAPVDSFARQREVRHISELIQPSHLIARVVILSVWETNTGGPYKRIAKAKVVDSVNEPCDGAVFELEYDTGFGCPNVGYWPGEDVLLFARQLPNGNYETVYINAGKMAIEDERIHKQPFPAGVHFSRAVAEIKREIRRKGSRQKTILEMKRRG